MTEKQILSLGFKKNEWEHDGETFIEFILGNIEGGVGILISGTTLVELTPGNGVFITVPNCSTIRELKQLIKLFGL